MFLWMMLFTIVTKCLFEWDGKPAIVFPSWNFVALLVTKTLKIPFRCRQINCRYSLFPVLVRYAFLHQSRQFVGAGYVCRLELGFWKKTVNMRTVNDLDMLFTGFLTVKGIHFTICVAQGVPKTIHKNKNKKELILPGWQRTTNNNKKSQKLEKSNWTAKILVATREKINNTLSKSMKKLLKFQILAGQ